MKSVLVGVLGFCNMFREEGLIPCSPQPKICQIHARNLKSVGRVEHSFCSFKIILSFGLKKFD